MRQPLRDQILPRLGGHVRDLIAKGDVREAVSSVNAKLGKVLTDPPPRNPSTASDRQPW